MCDVCLGACVRYTYNNDTRQSAVGSRHTHRTAYTEAKIWHLDKFQMGYMIMNGDEFLCAILHKRQIVTSHVAHTKMKMKRMGTECECDTEQRI